MSEPKIDNMGDYLKSINFDGKIIILRRYYAEVETSYSGHPVQWALVPVVQFDFFRHVSHYPIATNEVFNERVDENDQIKTDHSIR